MRNKDTLSVVFLISIFHHKYTALKVGTRGRVKVMDGVGPEVGPSCPAAPPRKKPRSWVVCPEVLTKGGGAVVEDEEPDDWRCFKYKYKFYNK